MSESKTVTYLKATRDEYDLMPEIDYDRPSAGGRTQWIGWATVVAVVGVGVVGMVLAETGEITGAGGLGFQVPVDPSDPTRDIYGRPIVQVLPRVPFDPNATVMNGDGVAQEGQPIGQNGELASDLERKQQLVKELVPVYQKAFAGPPWFEVSKCPTCPSGLSAGPVGGSCPVCGSGLTKEAYPANELYQSLLGRVSGSDSVVYIERLPNGQPVLGAILKNASQSEVLAKYAGRADPAFIARFVPERTLWLDEIFADLDARQSGNLGNLQEVIERSAQKLGTNTMSFRTINDRLAGKIMGIYGGRVQIVPVPDTGVPSGTSLLVTIRL